MTSLTLRALSVGFILALLAVCGGCDEKPAASTGTPPRGVTTPVPPAIPVRSPNVASVDDKPRAERQTSPHATRNPLKMTGGPMIKVIADQQGDTLHWVLATPDTAGRGDGGWGNIKVDGANYLRVGMARSHLDKVRKASDGESGVLGLVYSAQHLGLSTEITSIGVSNYGDPDPDLPGLCVVEVHVGSQQRRMAYLHERENGRFVWYRGAEKRSFRGEEVVPAGFRPLMGLRLLGVLGYDATEAVPQLNSLGTAAVGKYSTTHLRVRSLAVTNDSDAPSIDAVALIPKEGGVQLELSKMVKYGDGRFDLYPADAKVEGDNIHRVRSTRFPTMFVEELDALSWWFRKEIMTGKPSI